MEKCGFVYIWRDRKHNRYYIGSHLGTEDDGYVCSSRWMTAAMKRRPTDFKRRILERVNDKSELYNVEYKWLSMIKSTEIKTKYYNLRIHKFDHWSAYPEKVKTISEKISIKTKEAMQRPEVRAKYKEGLKTRDCKGSDPATIEKRRESMIKTMTEKFPEENRRKALTEEERKEYYTNKAKNMHASRSEEQRLEISKKLSEANKRNIRPQVTCPHCQKVGNAIVMKRWHFDNCKAIGG